MDAEGAGTAGCVTAEIRLLAEVAASSGRTAPAGRGPPPALSPSVRCRRHAHPVRQLQLLLLPPVGSRSICRKRGPLTCGATRCWTTGIPGNLSKSSGQPVIIGLTPVAVGDRSHWESSAFHVRSRVKR